SSVEFCHELGLDYVSCSPFRVPIARLAAAQAAINGMPAGKKKSPKASIAPSRGKRTGKVKVPVRPVKSSRSARAAQGKAASRRTR
ncbi:MAG: hypothetical protein H0X01_08185, partial [Nitrospira sp.]|nr:hypothetical protein [Nitrospira sp.]